jgi:FkbM family methyltransferase
MKRTIEGRWGKVSYFLKDEYVGKSIHNYGEYNPEETEKIISLAGSGLCLDIGANIGCITQALMQSDKDVVAFEPQPEVFKLLQENMSFSEKKLKCRAINAAVGDKVGEVEMPKVYYSAKGNFGGLGIGMTGVYGTYKVPCVTIDSYGFSNVSFMKIDVEGYETEVLEGATETILKYRPVLYIEDDRIENRSKLRKKISDLGYTYEMHQPPLYRSDNFLSKALNVWAPMNYASHNLICRPKVD